MTLPTFNFRLNRYSLLGLLGACAIAIGILFLTDWDKESVFFWIFAWWIFWWNRDARISIGFALLGLILIPILLEFERRDRSLFAEGEAETVAVWVYFFLVIGVAKQLWDHFRTPQKEEK